MVWSVSLSLVAVPALRFPVQWRVILRVISDRHTVSSSFSHPCRFVSTLCRVPLFVDVSSLVFISRPNSVVTGAIHVDDWGVAVWFRRFVHFHGLPSMTADLVTFPRFLINISASPFAWGQMGVIRWCLKPMLVTNVLN